MVHGLGDEQNGAAVAAGGVRGEVRDERAGIAVGHGPLADQLWLEGRTTEATQAYQDLAGSCLDEDRGRTLDVKSIAAFDPTMPAVRELLVGAPGRSIDSIVASIELGQLQATSSKPLAAYLVGKSLISRNRFSEAAPYFDIAIDAGAAFPARIQREAWRERVIAACVQSDKGTLGKMSGIIESDAPNPFRDHHGGRYEAIRRLLMRCR